MMALPKELIKKILLTSIGYKRISDIEIALPSLESISAIRSLSRYFYHDFELKYIFLQKSFYCLVEFTLKHPECKIYVYKENAPVGSLLYYVKASAFTNDTILFWPVYYDTRYVRLVLHNTKLILEWYMPDNADLQTYDVSFILYPNLFENTQHLNPNGFLYVEFRVK